jgi:hypothetical protein
VDAIEEPAVERLPDTWWGHEEVPEPVRHSPLRRARRWARHMFPARYAGVAAGGAMLLLGACAGIPVGIGKGTPLRGLLTVVATVAGFALLFAASLPRYRAGRSLRRWYMRRWPATIALSLLFAAGTVLTFDGGVLYTVVAPTSQAYQTDVVAFSDTNARLVLAGHNPYTSDHAFWQAVQRFPEAQMTPLRRGILAGAEDYPPVGWLRTVAQLAAADPAHSAALGAIYEPRTLHSYPALSFLLPMPLIAAGISNVLVLNLLVYLALFGWLVWQAPVGWRHWSALAAGSALVTVGASLFTETEVICVALILLAWHYRQHIAVSAVLLGLSCAFKQYAWFFAPFLLLAVYQQSGWRTAARYAALTGVAFLAPNLPFIVASPQAWWDSLWLPMSGHFFPSGMGLIALSAGHLLPLAPQQAYTALETAALVAMLWLAARRRAALGDALLLLPLVPLLFAFRSLAQYFAFMPWLALYAVNRVYVARRAYLPRESRLARDFMARTHALGTRLGLRLSSTRAA